MIFLWLSASDFIRHLTHKPTIIFVPLSSKENSNNGALKNASEQVVLGLQVTKPA